MSNVIRYLDVILSVAKNPRVAHERFFAALRMTAGKNDKSDVRGEDGRCEQVPSSYAHSRGVDSTRTGG